MYYYYVRMDYIEIIVLICVLSKFVFAKTRDTATITNIFYY